MIRLRLRLRFAAMLTLSMLVLCACVTPENAASGNQVRSIMYSQMRVPQTPRVAVGSDGVAATAAYTNFQKSYESPTPQGDNLTFGSTGK